MLQSQLGFLNYFRGYIPAYSELMAPIEALRKQGNNIKWLPEHSAVLAKVRKILESEVLLVAPDYTKELFVATDASKYGLAAILYQVDAEGTNQYIRMGSRSLKPAEINYGAPQREFRAVLEALRWFKEYLYGRRFVLYTDHQALMYMLTRDKISPVIENWVDEILSFDFKIEHIPGIANHLPDALSRFYDSDPRTVESKGYGALLGALRPLEVEELQDITEVFTEAVGSEDVEEVVKGGILSSGHTCMVILEHQIWLGC